MKQKTIEDYKNEMEKHGADSVIILIKKYGLNPFDQDTTSAMIEAYQQGASKSIEIAGEIAKSTVIKTPENGEELPF